MDTDTGSYIDGMEEDEPVVPNHEEEYLRAFQDRYPYMNSRPFTYQIGDSQYIPRYNARTIQILDNYIPMPLNRIGERHQTCLDKFIEKIENVNERQDVLQFFEKKLSNLSSIFHELSDDLSVLLSRTKFIVRVCQRFIMLDQFLSIFSNSTNIPVDEIVENPECLDQMDESTINRALLNVAQGLSLASTSLDNSNPAIVRSSAEDIDVTNIYRTRCPYQLYNDSTRTTCIRAGKGSYWFHNEKSFFQNATVKYDLSHISNYRISLMFPNLKHEMMYNPYPTLLPHVEIVLCLTERIPLREALDLFDTIKAQFPTHLLCLRLDDTFDKDMGLALDNSTFQFEKEEDATDSIETGRFVFDAITDESLHVYHPILYMENPVNQRLTMDCTSFARHERAQLENVMRQTSFAYLVQSTADKYREWVMFQPSFYYKYTLGRKFNTLNEYQFTVQNALVQFRLVPNEECTSFETTSLSQIYHIIYSIGLGQVTHLDLLEFLKSGSFRLPISSSAVDEYESRLSESTKSLINSFWHFY